MDVVVGSEVEEDCSIVDKVVGNTVDGTIE